VTFSQKRVTICKKKEDDMNSLYTLKIDAFAHVLPLKYKETLEKDYPSPLLDIRNPTLYDLVSRQVTSDG